MTVPRGDQSAASSWRCPMGETVWSLAYEAEDTEYAAWTIR